MCWSRTGVALAALLFGVGLADSSLAAAQFQGRCTSNAQCPVGTYCAETGVCVQPPTAAGAQPLYGQPEPARGARRRDNAGPIALMISGAVALGVGYIVNLFISLPAGAGTDWDRWADLRTFGAVPILGPWMQIAALPDGIDNASNWTTWFVVSGVLQGAGLALLATGIALLFADDGGYADLELRPVAGPGLAGLQLDGRF